MSLIVFCFLGLFTFSFVNLAYDTIMLYFDITCTPILMYKSLLLFVLKTKWVLFGFKKSGVTSWYQSYGLSELGNHRVDT